MSIRNRWFLLPAGLLSLLMIAAVACGGGTSSADKTATAGAGGGAKTAPSGTSTTGSADHAPADQQKVTIQTGEPEFYDPHRSNFEQDIAVARMLFRGLYN